MKLEKGKCAVAIRACVENGERLFDDAKLMKDFDRYSTAIALTILAEEEFAKAFLLHLVRDGAVPWTPETRRAFLDHKCKHLLAILMAHLSPGVDEWQTRAMEQIDLARESHLPSDVISAINLLRHEKVGKWENPFWDVLEPGDYDPETKRISDGSVDRTKQTALYVKIGRDGSVSTRPAAVRSSHVEKELKRCERFLDLAREISSGYVFMAKDYAALRQILSAVFAPAAVSSSGDQPEADAEEKDPCDSQPAGS
ncbi:MAG: AbiV family abortive infection protein [Verrucomicrobiia bacterium]